MSEFDDVLARIGLELYELKRRIRSSRNRAEHTLSDEESQAAPEASKAEEPARDKLHDPEWRRS